jgi:hypothetical protein
MLAVQGLLVYRIIQRQVRLSLHTHGQQLPGNKGATVIPTAAVVWSFFCPSRTVKLLIDDQEVEEVYRVGPHHLQLCDTLAFDYIWYKVPSA